MRVSYVEAYTAHVRRASIPGLSIFVLLHILNMGDATLPSSQSLSATTLAISSSSEEIPDCLANCTCQTRPTNQDTISLTIQCANLTVDQALEPRGIDPFIALAYNISELILVGSHIPSAPELFCQASEVHTLIWRNSDIGQHYFNQFSCLHQLSTLIIDECVTSSVGTLQSQNFTKLTGLFIQGNNISSIELDVVLHTSTSMEQMVLSNNGLTSVNVSTTHSFPSLTHLSLRNNSLASLEGSLSPGLSSLIQLDLSYNVILDVVPLFSCFDGSNLQLLDLSHNKIVVIMPGWLCSMTKLREIDLSYNAISVLRATTKTMVQCSVEKLVLSHNELQRVDSHTFASFSMLRYLDLSHNCIPTIEPELFVPSRGSFVSNPNDVLYDKTNEPKVMANSLVTPQGMMDVIDLSFNNISLLSRHGVETSLALVRRLSLAHNHISHLPRYGLERLSDLEHIDLSHNKLDWLDVGTFKNAKLRYIDLSHNKILKLISMAFLYLPRIEFIDLSHNKLKYLYRYVLYRTCEPGDTLHTVINLDHNHLQSDVIWKLVSTFKNIEDTYCSVNVSLQYNRVTDLLGEAADTYATHIMDSDSGYFAPWDHVFFDVRNNPLHCDCALYDHAHTLMAIGNMFAGNFSRSGTIDFWRQLTCVRPRALANMAVESALPLIRCNISDSCPHQCSCYYVPANQIFVVDCAARGLHEWPSRLPPGHKAVNLSGNNLDYLAHDVELNGIETLDLSNNRFKHFPPALWQRLLLVPTVLLHSNDLRWLSRAGLEGAPSGTRNLTLSDNPLTCECGTLWLHHWLVNNSQTISDLAAVTCGEGPLKGHAIINITESQLQCPIVFQSLAAHSSPISVVVCILASIIMLVTMCSIALIVFHRHRRRIRIHSIPVGLPRPLDELPEGDADVLIYSDKAYYKWTCEHVIDKLVTQRPPYTIHHLEYAGNMDVLTRDFLGQSMDNYRSLIFVVPGFNQREQISHQSKDLPSDMKRSKVVICISVELPGRGTLGGSPSTSSHDIERQNSNILGLNFQDRLFYEKLFYILPPPSEKQYLDVTVYNRLLENSPAHYKKY